MGEGLEIGLGLDRLTQSYFFYILPFEDGDWGGGRSVHVLDGIVRFLKESNNLDGESGKQQTHNHSNSQFSLALVSLQIRKIVGRGTPLGKGRRGTLPVTRRLVQGCYSLGTPEVVVTEASTESVDSIVCIYA
jgi:hypothetical protein